MDFFSNSTETEVIDFYKSVSNNIKQKRLEYGLKQLDVALEIGIKSVAFYSNCENLKYGKHFNLEHVYKLAKLFNVPPHELLK
ncbi:transcriptional regulator, XRE family [Arcobacter nitrofigilis DSM 7299]|uniref:Transcriptional regulator, XRE family n=1 Tax=Arcobacter nitrofigilis (strain ATCC 33309 / DSM 7299 / CCUG 15893 / LMG 7604 / NCTC 12251 / CI) TaxID=572480 RepID=D5V3S6_ARCNC|nr:helix-turn-helix transcriptional regulator [Arcobacter nitrofigilis]ADG92754.1 transcriptional regulator, XRE family [Arcobacter nitrofigilis DSM 7299]